MRKLHPTSLPAHRTRATRVATRSPLCETRSTGARGSSGPGTTSPMGLPRWYPSGPPEGDANCAPVSTTGWSMHRSRHKMTTRRETASRSAAPPLCQPHIITRISRSTIRERSRSSPCALHSSRNPPATMGCCRSAKAFDTSRDWGSDASASSPSSWSRWSESSGPESTSSSSSRSTASEAAMSDRMPAAAPAELPPSPAARGQPVHREAVRAKRVSGLAGLGWVRRPGSTHPRPSVPLATHSIRARRALDETAERRRPPEGTARARRWVGGLRGRELGCVDGLPPPRRPGPKQGARRGAPTAARSKRPGRPGSFAMGVQRCWSPSDRRAVRSLG